jgi:hypothetical protein
MMDRVPEGYQVYDYNDRLNEAEGNTPWIVPDDGMVVLLFGGPRGYHGQVKIGCP